MPKPGDLVKVSSKGKVEEGVLMPSPKDEVIMLKLNNGYNMGFSKKRC